MGGKGTHNGTGKLTLPSEVAGKKLFRLLFRNKDQWISLYGRTIGFKKLDGKPPHHIQQTLDRTPYLEPEKEEVLEEKLAKLDIGIHVDKVQFGVFFLESGASATATRKFSNEFEVSHVNKGAGILQFEYLHKLIRVQVRFKVYSTYF